MHEFEWFSENAKHMELQDDGTSDRDIPVFKPGVELVYDGWLIHNYNNNVDAWEIQWQVYHKGYPARSIIVTSRPNNYLLSHVPKNLWCRFRVRNFVEGSHSPWSKWVMGSNRQWEYSAELIKWS